MNGAELKTWRARHHLTQERLAALLDVDHMSVSRWERGVYQIPRTVELALDALSGRLSRGRGRGRQPSRTGA